MTHEEIENMGLPTLLIYLGWEPIQKRRKRLAPKPTPDPVDKLDTLRKTMMTGGKLNA